MNNLILSKHWMNELLDDCQTIITETVFNSRWALVEGYWKLGKRILEEHDGFERNKIYGKDIATLVANSLGKSKRTVHCSIKFAKKFPNLDDVPEGKNISWHKIVNKYLPDETKKKDEDLSVDTLIWEVIKNSSMYRILDKYEKAEPLARELEQAILKVKL